MGNPRNRPKHLQHRSWFRFNIDGRSRIVRPVDGEAWFNEPGLSCGLVHLIDENYDRLAIVEVGVFNKNAVRVSGVDLDDHDD